MRALVVVALVLALWPAAALAQAGCSFQNGFKAIADQIPEVVGACASSEYGAPDGVTRQLSTAGYFGWRAADNATWFTAGTRTWLLTADGVQEQGGAAAAANPLAEQKAAETSALIRRVCFTTVQDLLSYNRALGNYVTDAGAWARAAQDQCFTLAWRDSTPGLSCFVWTYQTMAWRTKNVPRWPAGEYERAADTLYGGCAGRGFG